MQPSIFCKYLEFYGYNLILGIHDTAFASLLAALRPSSTLRHVTCNDDLEACAMAAGYYLGTGKAPLIYMEDISIADAVNTLNNLLQHYDHSIPALLLIATPSTTTPTVEQSSSTQEWSRLQEFLQFPSKYVSNDATDFHQTLTEAEAHFRKNSTPFVIIVPENIFETEAVEKDLNAANAKDMGEIKRSSTASLYVGKSYRSSKRSFPSRSKFRF